MISEDKSRRPVELSSIINVVQHDQSHHKMELKSVVHLGNNGTRKSSSNGVKGHDTKTSKTSKSVNEKPVLLLPFGHQVSGRASMLCYDETTILKPYVSRELYFYQSMPHDLKRLAPQFRGLVTVSFIEDSTTASILAYALPRTLVKPSSKSIIKLFAEEPKPHSKRCVKDFGKTHVIYPSHSSEMNTSYSDDENEDLFVEAGGDFIPIISQVRNNDDDDDVVSELSQGFDVTVCIKDKKPSGKENDDQNFSTTGLHNPWNSKVLDDAWLKLKFTDTDNPSNGKKKRFTLLENVVARYRRPCVLDLKIGTRVRENASPEKIARHVTAINLGARLSGMQIYHPKQEKFSYHNKYYGHNLTVSGFKSNLRHFFSRGTIPVKGSAKGNKPNDDNKSSIDRSLVKEAMKKLTQLRDAVELMQSHRFYSSSVLLLYEGDVEEEEEEQDPEELSSDEVVDAIPENPPEADEDVSHTTPASITTLSDQKGTPRSFSFSEFLQRLKQNHSKHQMKRAHENSSKHHDDSKKNSQKYMKGSVICKYEKSRRQIHENDDEKSHKTHHHHHHHSRHHRDFEDAHESSFPSKSWPPRSKSASTSSSQKSRHHERARNQDESTKTHSRESPMEITSSDEKKSRKVAIEGGADKNDHSDHEKHHHDAKKSHEDVRTYRRDVIDVRMIDFAHYCFHDNSMHPGPDGGFLFGLENLIRLLGEMLKL